MKNLRITNRKLTDGSTVYAVAFHVGDTEVTLECESEVAARRVEKAMAEDVSYVEVSGA